MTKQVPRDPCFQVASEKFECGFHQAQLEQLAQALDSLATLGRPGSATEFQAYFFPFSA